MGATMVGIIEWTHDAHCAARRELNLPLGAPRWEDDYLHGILFETDKEYDFFAAVSGARNRFGKPPLIPRRGLPRQTSIPASVHLNHFGAECSGWLHLSEIDACIRHISDGTFVAGLEIEIALDLMRSLVARFTDQHVRMVFDIESA